MPDETYLIQTIYGAVLHNCSRSGNYCFWGSGELNQMIISTILTVTAAAAAAAASYALKHSKQQQHLITKLNKDVDILRGLLEDRRKHYVSDFKAVHDRIDLSNVRHMHIEHYIGLRSHSFSKGERMWDYFQIAKDLRTGNAERPKSAFYSNRKRS